MKHAHTTCYKCGEKLKAIGNEEHVKMMNWEEEKWGMRHFDIDIDIQGLAVIEYW